MTWDRAPWLIAGLSLPLIVLFHLLARRRRELTVPSLHLWNLLLENEKPSLRLRRLVADLLLVLQLAAAVLVVLALAGPRLTRTTHRISSPTVLAIDVSAGMAAPGGAGVPGGPDAPGDPGALRSTGGSRGSGGTRLDEALREAEALVRGKALQVEMAILAGGESVLPVSGFTRSRRDLLAALDSIGAPAGSGATENLLRASAALAASRSGSRVIFITDGAFDVPRGTGSGVETLAVGGPQPNTGITMVRVRDLPGGAREVGLSFGNYGSGEVELSLRAELDERLLASEKVVLAPGETTDRTYVEGRDTDGRLHVVLEGSGPDGLAADNEAELSTVSGTRRKVVLFTTGNWFLETLLRTHPGLDLAVVTVDGESAAAERAAAAGDADIVILDRVAPPIPPELPVIAIYPFEGSPPALPLAFGAPVGGGSPVSWNPAHPVMAGVDLSRVSVSRSLPVQPVPGTRILAESESGPLVLCGDDGVRRWMALAFDPLESSLPVTAAFPVLFSNALDWLAAGGPAVIGPVFADLPGAGESNLNPRWNSGLDVIDDAALPPEERPGIISPDTTIPDSRPLLTVLLILSLLAVSGEWLVQVRLWRRR